LENRIKTIVTFINSDYLLVAMTRTSKTRRLDGSSITGWNRTIPKLDDRMYCTLRERIRGAVYKLLDFEGELYFSDTKDMDEIFEASRGSYHSFLEFLKGISRREGRVAHLGPGEWGELAPGIVDLRTRVEIEAEKLLDRYDCVNPQMVADSLNLPQRNITPHFKIYRTNNGLVRAIDAWADERGRMYHDTYYIRP